MNDSHHRVAAFQQERLFESLSKSIANDIPVRNSIPRKWASVQDVSGIRKKLTHEFRADGVVGDALEKAALTAIRYENASIAQEINRIVKCENGVPSNHIKSGVGQVCMGDLDEYASFLQDRMMCDSVWVLASMSDLYGIRGLFASGACSSIDCTVSLYSPLTQGARCPIVFSDGIPKGTLIYVSGTNIRKNIPLYVSVLNECGVDLEVCRSAQGWFLEFVEWDDPDRFPQHPSVYTLKSCLVLEDPTSVCRMDGVEFLER